MDNEITGSVEIMLGNYSIILVCDVLTELELLAENK